MMVCWLCQGMKRVIVRPKHLDREFEHEILCPYCHGNTETPQ